MSSGQQVVCQQCGQAYQMNREANPWPPCPRCQGKLVALGQSHAQSPQTAAGNDPFGGPLNNMGNATAAPLYGYPPKPNASNGFPFVFVFAASGVVVGLGTLVLAAVLLFRPTSSRSNTIVASRPESVPNVPPVPPPTSNPVPPLNQVSPPRPLSPPTPPANSLPPSEPPPARPEKTIREIPKPPASNVAPGKIRSSENSQTGFGTNTGSKVAFEPRVPWGVTLDPPEAIEYPVSEKPFEFEFKMRVDHLIFPHRPGPFFAAENDDYKNHEVRIFDMRTGRSNRKIPGELNNNKKLSAISADGEQMATVISRGTTTIVIANSKTGKAVHSIEMEQGNNIQEIAFGKPGRFFAIIQSSDRQAGCQVAVWDTANGKAVCNFPLENPVVEKYSNSFYYRDGSFAVSPGGKYVAFAIKNVVVFYELETGKIAGEIQTSPEDRGLDQPSLAFSADGSELTMMNGYRAEGSVLYRMDVAQGELLGSVKINMDEFKDSPSYQNLGRLQYLNSPESYLVDGSYVIERSSGETLCRVDAFSGMTRVVDGKRLVGVVSRSNSFGMAEYRLPVDELDKLAAVLKGGGKLLDGIWGEAKTTDLQTGRKLEEPLSSLPWDLEFADPPSRLVAKKSLPLPTAPRDSQHNATWTYDGPLFSATGQKVAWLPVSIRHHSRLNVFDVTTGASEGNIDMLPGSRLLDVSPDGSLVAAALGRKQFYGATPAFERLEFFSIPLKKHVLAIKLFAPFASESNRLNQTNPRLFQKAFFIEKSLVLTVMEGGRLLLWKLPEAKLEWVLDSNAEVVKFTADRSHVLLNFPQLKKLSWLEVRTGKWCGDLVFDGQIGRNLAVSPTSKRVASVQRLNGYTRIFVFGVGKEEPQHFTFPAISGELDWLNERYLVSKPEGIVIDTENGAPVWRVGFDGKLQRGPDGTSWLLGNDSRAMQLTKIPFPSDAFLAKFKSAKGTPIEPIIGPGSRLAIRGGFLSDEQTNREMESEFSRRGWIRDDNSPLSISATSTKQPDQTKEFVKRLTGERQTATIPGGTIIAVTIFNGGTELHTAQTGHGGGHVGDHLYLKQGETVQNHVHSAGPARPSISSLPDYVFPKDPFRGLGQSRVNEKGDQF